MHRPDRLDRPDREGDGATPVTESPRGGRTRGGFGAVVLGGLATAALAAVACAKPWIGGAATGGSQDAQLQALDQGTRYPLASAVSLVLVAAWGVLLVTRGVVRRAFAWLVALTSLGLVATVVAGFVTLPGSSRDSFAQAMGRASPDQGWNGWFWMAAGASLLALVPALTAPRRVRSWPEMGQRYDAPAGARSTRRSRTTSWSPTGTSGWPWTRGATPPRRRRPTSPDRRRARDRAPEPGHRPPHYTLPTTRTPDPRRSMSDNHGNTPAAWTAVVVALAGFVVAGIGLMIYSWPVFWIGVALGPVAAVAGLVVGKITPGSETKDPHSSGDAAEHGTGH